MNVVARQSAACVIYAKWAMPTLKRQMPPLASLRESAARALITYIILRDDMTPLFCTLRQHGEAAIRFLLLFYCLFHTLRAARDARLMIRPIYYADCRVLSALRITISGYSGRLKLSSRRRHAKRAAADDDRYDYAQRLTLQLRHAFSVTSPGLTIAGLNYAARQDLMP